MGKKLTLSPNRNRNSLGATFPILRSWKEKLVGQQTNKKSILVRMMSAFFFRLALIWKETIAFLHLLLD